MTTQVLCEFTVGPFRDKLTGGIDRRGRDAQDLFCAAARHPRRGLRF